MKNYTVVSIFFLILLLIGSGVQAADRLELEDTSIIGSRELPKVLYIVPWKKSRIGTLAGVSEKGSFKEGMSALDRDIFLREIKYYSVVSSPGAVPKK